MTIDRTMLCFSCFILTLYIPGEILSSSACIGCFSIRCLDSRWFAARLGWNSPPSRITTASSPLLLRIPDLRDDGQPASLGKLMSLSKTSFQICAELLGSSVNNQAFHNFVAVARRIEDRASLARSRASRFTRNTS